MQSAKVVSLATDGDSIEYGVSLDDSNDPAERLACSAPAEWELCGVDPYDITYSCNKHLSDMTAIDTRVINAMDEESKEACCFIATTNDDFAPAVSVNITIWKDSSVSITS